MNAAPLTLRVLGLGAIGPGFANHAELRDRFAAAPRLSALDLTPPTQLPVPDILPPAERRRASPIIKAALAAGLEACAEAGLSPQMLPTVFSSSGSYGVNCAAICTQLATDDRLISPTRFHNSVHNTVAGYWGIATGCMAASQAISAEDGSFAAGLLEAAVQSQQTRGPVLLISYDTGYPLPLDAVRHIADTAALALLVDVQTVPADVSHLHLQLRQDTAAKLDPFTQLIPTLAGLHLLYAMQHGGTANLYFQPGLFLDVTVQP